MNRRSFIKGMAAVTASGFILPGLIVPEEPEKRFWALGGLPQKRYTIIGYAYPQHFYGEDVYGKYYLSQSVTEADHFSEFYPGAVILDRKNGDHLWRMMDTDTMRGNVTVLGEHRLIDSR